MANVVLFSTLLSQINFTWYNEPKRWSINETTVYVHTDKDTDFWQRTFYGFQRDTGHFLYKSLSGDQPFNLTVNVRGKYRVLYDQGGLMIRIDNKNWIKCGVEYVEGQQYASAVVTVDGWSDWNVVRINAPDVLRLRVRRVRETIHIEFAEDLQSEFKMMRLAYFPVIERTRSMMVGVMCASPDEKTNGFDIYFEDLTIVGEPYTDSSTSVRYSSAYLLFLLAYLLIQ
ncbi:unnamed protein product [Adineta ricciae]|uniref:DUF1349 domain-containing protein n=1 Tax=Adineta ricciae TaxID=249248 RepID=A0A816AYK8_ADIRI|nr:unnamed protein product [Adineta ricciae]CAF1603391.1 unnamed protein product [Adineta ricciae]